VFVMANDATRATVIPPACVVQGLRKTYRRTGGPFPWQKRMTIAVLQDIDLTLDRGQVLGVWGPSGSGKSTLARCLACLEPSDAGELVMGGRRVDLSQSQPRQEMRAFIQLVLQDSAAALNPNFSAIEAVREPLDILRKGSKRDRYDAARTAMDQVGLVAIPPNRNVTQMSGGQRQRLALARSLICRPAVLVLDETLSGLDLAIQAEIVNLLLDLQDQISMSCIFISHNRSLTRHLADQVLVLRDGRISREGFS
jgi:dipeptide transport system ATP-binding protein